MIVHLASQPADRIVQLVEQGQEVLDARWPDQPFSLIGFLVGVTWTFGVTEPTCLVERMTADGMIQRLEFSTERLAFKVDA